MDRFALGYEAWPILVAHARSTERLFYKDLALALGYKTPKVSRAALWSIQDFCIEKGLPPLTSIVVNKTTGAPGAGFKLGSATLDDAQQRAFAFDWSSVPRPFAPQSLSRIRVNRTSPNAQEPTAFTVPDSEVTVNGRGPYQDRFRAVLMQAYGHCCALCESRHRSMLIASHIVPWADDSQNRLNPHNGLLLCRTLDAAFECGLIRIKPDGEVIVAISDARQLGKDLHDYLRRTQHKLRAVSPRFAAAPEFLQWRYSRAKA